jgi:ribosomal-protein-alanine N-acetyltransferase
VVTGQGLNGPVMKIVTRRLVMEPVDAADQDALHALWSSPGVRRFLWDDEVIPIERTREAVAFSRAMQKARGHGLWAARLAGTTPLCGFGGLWPFRDPPELELLYGVAEPFWGRGYATEIGDAIVRYCTQSLGMSTLRASTDAENLASVRVLEKLGFRFVTRRTVDGLDTVFYQWQADAGHSCLADR